jgi:anti-sigma factor ChrR (cupin superfamily)
MRHDRVTDELREQAAAHALGLLDPGAARAFEQHLEACPVCEAELRAFQETAAALPLALPESAPPPALRQKLLGGKDRVVRAGAGDWTPTGFEGVEVKELFVHPAKDEVTMLVRMSPGAAYPAHHYAGHEQCYVLEGELRIGDLVLRAGDYSCAPPDTTHAPPASPLGYLLLIVANRHDAVVA